jgi:uracil-DNA glycosylase
MKNLFTNINNKWFEKLKSKLDLNFFETLNNKFNIEQNNYVIFPCYKDIFNAYNLTDLRNIKVVIIGQDPYHGDDQAHGLSFSIRKGYKIPPSLRNIFKELYRDMNIDYPLHGNLEKWSAQGVFLLNSSLTVRRSEANSHKHLCWQEFTDATIEIISYELNNVVFLLWGKDAQEKENLIDSNKHYVLKTSHPSPFSARRGFIGCSHFSKTNAYLLENDIKEIDWSLDL